MTTETAEARPGWLGSVRRAGTLIVSCVVLGGAACPPADGATSRRPEQRLVQEQRLAQRLDARLARFLPVGTPLSRALAVLDSLRVERGEFDRTSGTVVGIVRDVARARTTRTALQVTLVFGEGGTLRARRVVAVFTGP